jgi:MFS family permease
MQIRKLASKSNTSIRDTLANIILITNALVWYFFAIAILAAVAGQLENDALLIWSVHFGAITISAIVGAALLSKTRSRTRVLKLWMLLGVISSIIVAFLDTNFLPNTLLIAGLFGVSLGIGMPCAMGYFTQTIKMEQKGKISGIIFLISGVIMAGIGIALPTSNESLQILPWQTLLLLAWRTGGLILFMICARPMVSEQKTVVKSSPSSYRSIITHRNFLLYLIPWILFSMITYLTVPIQEIAIKAITPRISYSVIVIIDNALTGIFAIIGGFLVDKMGRKRISIIAFATLGVGYSIIGFFLDAGAAWYIFAMTDGIAWGMLYVIFVLVIWGDLGSEGASDRYYALGVLPFFLSKFLQLTVGSSIKDVILPTSIFSFTAFFLFLAVLPLFYAPETLPEKVMKDRDLKSYVEKAKKEVQKRQNKIGLAMQTDIKIEKPKKSESDKEYEEAQQLAEKYY